MYKLHVISNPKIYGRGQTPKILEGAFEDGGGRNLGGIMCKQKACKRAHERLQEGAHRGAIVGGQRLHKRVATFGGFFFS